MLTEIVAAFVDKLRLIPGIVAAPDYPEPNNPDARSLLIYPQPGQSTPWAHSGRNHKPMFECRDVIIVEWRMLIAPDQTAAAFRAAMPMLDALRAEIWTMCLPPRNLDRLITGIYAIDSEPFGDETESSDIAFGFRLLVSISHVTEIS